MEINVPALSTTGPARIVYTGQAAGDLRDATGLPIANFNKALPF
jgi:hypothetical protein